MRNASWLLALMVALAGSKGATAQGFLGLGSLGLGDPVWRGGTTLSFSRHSYYRGGHKGPSFRASYVSGSYILGLPTGRLALAYYAPPMALTPRSALVFAPARRDLDDDDADQILPPLRRLPAEPAPFQQQLAPGDPASVFRPIRQQDRDRARRAEVPDKPVPPQPMPRREEPVLPGPAAPDADPTADSARQIRIGKEAFSQHEYARAERRFQQAASLVPRDAQAYFLLGQTRFALGKYQEAVAALEAGLRLDPSWAGSRFRVRDWYEPNAADLDSQRERLLQSVGRYPNDPFLLFLYAYQLWFDDRQVEALAYFVRHRAVSPDPQLTDRFLQARPTLPIIIW